MKLGETLNYTIPVSSDPDGDTVSQSITGNPIILSAMTSQDKGKVLIFTPTDP